MQVQAYLNFAGRCEEALDFYKQAIAADVIMMMRWKESPDPQMQAASGREEKIMHAAFKVGESTLMADDGMASEKSEFKGVTLALSAASDAETQRRFDALARGGNIQMPLTKTFWTSSFGMLQDKFGVSWMVMTESP